MLRSFCILLLLLAFDYQLLSQEKYKAESGLVSFFSSAPLEDIYAENRKVQSLIDISSQEFAFVIPIAGFTFKKSLMQTHFNEKYLESDKFPNAIFTGKFILEEELNTSSKNEVIANGKIKIHGVSQQISVPAIMDFKGGKLYVNAEFILRPKDFDIRIPRILIKNIAEEVEVKVNMVYRIVHG